MTREEWQWRASTLLLRFIYFNLASRRWRGQIANGIGKFNISNLQGCSEFNFQTQGGFRAQLVQRSENPAVYAKLSCYLPWVAAQYDMDYLPPGEPHPACTTGNGEITEVTAEVCRTNPRDAIDREASCLFPFTLNGKIHNTCIQEEIEDFTRPVFRCPIRTLKDLGTDYTDDHLRQYFCPTNRCF